MVILLANCGDRLGQVRFGFNWIVRLRIWRGRILICSRFLWVCIYARFAKPGQIYSRYGAGLAAAERQGFIFLLHNIDPASRQTCEFLTSPGIFAVLALLKKFTPLLLCIVDPE